MAMLSLKVAIEERGVVKTLQLSAQTKVEDACAAIRDKLPEAQLGDAKEYGLFLPVAGEEGSGGANTTVRGVWLENGRALDYYMLRNGDTLHYARKLRNLRVRMLDGAVKTMLVDDSQPVANLMVVICTKIGITNHDEYGLVREELKDEEERTGAGVGTLTLRRRHQEKERDAKMEQLRRKLRTDDEVSWVEGGRTLREQGVGPTETVLLRRRLFYSDRCVDARDPVQLNLLYVQARDNILDGTHPVTQRKACEFAGIQCQVQFGDHKEDKHTPGLIDLKEFLPASYAKVKGLEKKVLKEHATHAGLSELDAKLLYTQQARALPTYGVAFFLVKEKMKGKNKLVPRLLGVNKESVLRLDERTKEVLQTWPLTTVRRWCASPNTFTLDFGDYSDQYYSVQTTEAEQILQVIAGYIDLIVRRRQRTDHLSIDGQDGSAMMEDSVSPSRANIIQHDTFKSGKAATESVAKPAVVRPGADGAKPFAVVHTMSAQQTTVSGQIVTGHAPPAASTAQETRITEVRAEPKRALLEAIKGGRELLRHTEETLTTIELSEVEAAQAQNADWRAQRVAGSARGVAARLAAMGAAAASVVTLTAGPTEEVDHSAVGAAVTTITASLPEVTHGVQRIAALLDDAGGEKLLDATRALCRAFSDLLTAAEPDTPQPRQSILNAASRVGEASTSVLTSMGVDNEDDKETQEIVLSLAKGAANAAAALVLGAKQLAARAEPAQQQAVVAAATHAALTTSQLVATAKVVAPSLQSSACRAQLAAAARAVARAVQRVLAACEPPPAQAAAAHHQLTTAAHQLGRELERLLAHCQLEEDTSLSSAERVVAAGERVVSAPPQDVVRRARTLGHATAQLITIIKSEAEAAEQSGDGAGAAGARRLLAAAKLLADATARLLEAARQCAANPQDRTRQEAVRLAAEEVREVAAEYTRARAGGGARLADATRRVVDAARHLIDVARQQECLESECSTLSSTLIRAEEVAMTASDRDTAPLVAAAENMLQACGSALSGARALAPALPPPAARPLADATHALTTATADLRSSVRRARATHEGSELEEAARTVRAIRVPAGVIDTSVTNETYISQLHSSGRALSGHAAALAAAGGRLDRAPAARAAPALAASLDEFARATAGVAHTAENSQQVVDAGEQVIYWSLSLIETVHRHFTSSETVDSTELTTLAHNISQGVSHTVSLASARSAADDALQTIQQAHTQRRASGHTKDITTLQSSLQECAAALSEAAGAAAARQPDAAPALAQHCETLIQITTDIGANIQESELVERVERRLAEVVTSSTELLRVVKATEQEPSRPNSAHDLSVAARALTDALNQLVDTCMECSGDQQGAQAMRDACLAAARRVHAASSLLHSVPTQHQQHQQLVEELLINSKALSEGMASLAGAARRSERAPFIAAAAAVADAAVGLVDTAAMAAHLTGVSSPGSSAGRAGLVDSAAVGRAAAAIETACDTLTTTNATQQQVLSAATAIAKHTSALCAACRAASARSGEPLAKRMFVHAAKDVANATALLVADIKALDADYSEENRARCASATAGLRAAVRGLRAFADSPEFAAVAPDISHEGRQAMEPLLQCGRDVISGTSSLLEAASSLAIRADDAAAWRSLATHGQSLSQTVKTLVTYTRDNAPGQRACSEALEQLERLQLLVARAAGGDGDSGEKCSHSELQGYLEQIESSGAELCEQLTAVTAAARGAPEQLPHALRHVVRMSEALQRGACGAASSLEPRARHSLLSHVQTVLEALAMLVRAARAAGGNPRAEAAQAEVTSCANQCDAALRELATVSRSEAARLDVMAPLVESLSRSVARLAHNRMSMAGFEESASFGDYQAKVTASAKQVAKLAHDLVSSRTEGTQPHAVAGSLVSQYEQLARDVVCACAAAPTPDAADSIRAAALDLGEAAVELLQRDRDDHSDGTRVTHKTALLLSALQAGARGSQACADAAAAIGSVIGDLDTTILFASAGTLQSDIEGDSFGQHREGILRTAKALVEDTKALVGGAGGDQQTLADAAMAARTTLVELCNVTKAGAAALGGTCGGGEGQVLVLQAARDAAAALRDLCAATAAAAGRPHHSPHMQHLKHAAKVMVTNVTSLLKTVKAVEDEHSRGARALEAAIDSIEQEIEELMSDREARAPATAEDVARLARAMPATAARAVAAGTNQDKLTAAANTARRDISALLQACKGAASTAESASIRTRTLEAGRSCAVSVTTLLRAALHGGDAAAAAHAVASATAELLAVADVLKGAEWAEVEAVVAESELLGAAAAVDAAADQLATLTVAPQQQDVSGSDGEVWEGCEGALSASRDIVAATAELVRAAAAAQRDLVEQGVVPRRPAASTADGQWALGLVSAARLAAAAARALAAAAAALAAGQGSEERLVSSARQLASSTAQLLVACKVKADPAWASTRRLVSAGARVLRAADALVLAARACSARRDQRSLVLDRRVVGGIAQEIDARSEVLRIEKELEEARGRLTAIRQAKYRMRGSPDDSAHDGGGYDTSRSNTSYDNYSTLPKSPNYTQDTSFGHNASYGQNNSYGHNTSYNTSGLTQDHSQTHERPSFAQDRPYNQNTSNFGQNTSSFGQNTSNFGQNTSTFGQNTSTFTQNTSFGQNTSSFTQQSPGGEAHSEVTSRTQLGTFKPQEPPRNYEGFTTRENTIENDRTMTDNYETKLYDTPRPADYRSVEEQRLYQRRETRNTPLSPSFNARELKHDTIDNKLYSHDARSLDGIGHNFSEHQKTTEQIPGGVKHSEYSIKSESYSSQPQTEIVQTITREEAKSPFTTSTPAKFHSKIQTPEFERVSSPYTSGNVTEESTTEVKDIPNGTQKITTTKIYSSSPVNLTSTSTKFEPVALEGIDELSRTFMRPSQFQSTNTDSMERQFAKQTLSSQTIERKSVTTSEHKSQTSSTVTKKFGNF